jgi:hypothetical protein
MGWVLFACASWRGHQANIGTYFGQQNANRRVLFSQLQPVQIYVVIGGSDRSTFHVTPKAAACYRPGFCGVDKRCLPDKVAATATASKRWPTFRACSSVSKIHKPPAKTKPEMSKLRPMFK